MTLKGSYLRSQWSDLAEIQTRPRLYALITCKYKKDGIESNQEKVEGWDRKQPRKGGDTFFPIIHQLGLSVAMDIRVLIQSDSKHYAAFPHSQRCYTYNLIKIGHLASDIFESVKFCHSRASNSKVSSSPKSDSSELLYLSWLPATLMMIRSKMNELAWRVSDLIWPKYEPVQDFKHVLASIKRIGSKATEKRWRHRFPNCKSMGPFCYH